MEIDTIDDCMVCSSSEIENCFDLDSWEKNELFGKATIPKAINYSIPITQVLPLIIISMNMGLLDGLKPVLRREKKAIRNRQQSWNFILSWSADLFYRQFRLPREEFFVLSERIKSIYPGTHSSGLKNYQFAQLHGSNSSPESGPITIELKLAITLRLLAGASHLDMIWYGVQSSTVSAIFNFLLPLIDIAYPEQEIYNFNPENSSKVAFNNLLHQLSNEWSSIMIARKGHDLCKGTILAGDGVVIPIAAPTENDRMGLPLANFRNRKGCYAVNAQGFCDAWCRFRYFEVSWPGSTNDITSNRQTKLYSWFQDNLIDDCFHMMLDEAYGSVGGNQHLSPFTKHQLIKARKESNLKYCKMKAFNNILSSQRITIERAFGIFMRKWGIMWRPLEHSLGTNLMIIKVCSKLHNVSINYWMRAGKRSDEIETIERAFVQQRDSGVFLAWAEDRLYGEDILDLETYNNQIPNEPIHRMTADRKEAITEKIYGCGIEYNLQMDNDFTLN